MGADVERSELKDGSVYTGLEGLLKMLRGFSMNLRIGQQAGYSFLPGYFRTADSC
ncbi:hypothetical protein BTEQ31S_01479 [Bacillus tequilensis]